MQTSTQPFNTTSVASVKRSTPKFNTCIDPIDNNATIGSFTLRRSIASNQLVNVVAVDKKNNVLAVVQTDLSFNDGMDMVNILNTDLTAI